MAKTSLAKAYVQIVPSADGIKGSIANVLGDESQSAGKLAGTSIVSSIKKIIVGAGIGKALSSALTEGANLQQSIGGIETMFKDSADTMKKYAQDAYKTAGISANSYMEQATSFSASLLSSLGGDTAKAAEAANQAIIDMADNSNKMGTSIEMIQNAYQGFAKQNYTMLDNLKLGYGGTKTEMERLLKDAQKISGVKYDISNLNDVYSAIHVIQTELGITGTTSKEAATTVTGSLNAMKSSLSNLIGAMALGESIKEPLQGLLETTGTFLFNNLIPMVGNAIKSIPQIITEIVPQLIEKGTTMLLSLSEGFENGFPQLASKVLDLAQNLGTWLSEQMPVLINKGFEMLSNLVDGIINALPEMISRLPAIISTFANIINDNFPTILQKGAELLMKLINGIISCIPTLIANIPQIILAIVDTLMAFNWLNLGKNIIVGLGNGIKSMIGTIKSSAKSIFDAVVNSLKDSPSKMISIGKDMIKGLWNGISNMAGWIMDKIGGFASSILGGIKSFFGINSPSKVFEMEVGKMLPLGMAEGIQNNTNAVVSSMKDLGKATVSIAKDDISTFRTVGSNATVNSGLDGITIVFHQTTELDSKPLMEKTSEYTLRKIGNKYEAQLKARGA